MTDRKSTTRKPGKKVKIDKLELSRETVKDLTDTQAERVEGGRAADQCCKSASCCTDIRSGC